MRILRIDTQATRHPTMRQRIKPLKLSNTIKRNMRRATHNLIKRILRIRRRIRMCPTPKTLQSQTRLIWRRRRSMPDILTKYRERLPQSKRLKSKNNLSTRTISHLSNQLKVTTQQTFLYNIIRCIQTTQISIKNYIRHIKALLNPMQSYIFSQ